jgi:hypothetical protein
MAVATVETLNRSALARMLKSIQPAVPKNWFSWASYVTPTSMVETILRERIKPLMVAEMTMPFTDDETIGWQMHLAERAAQITHSTPEAQYRRIYCALNEEAIISYTRNVEGWLMACNLDIDTDTNLPTLPGCKKYALDLLQIRAEALDPNVELEDVMHLVAPVIELSYAIVTNPEQMEQLQDDAPFDCLRPPQR